MGNIGKAEYCLRFLILLGYCVWFSGLYFTGNLNLYIHERFHILPLITAGVMLFLAIVQILSLVAEKNNKTTGKAHSHTHSCSSHPVTGFKEESKKRPGLLTDDKKNIIKKALTYLVFIVPLTFGLVISPASLDPAMAGQRGFNIEIGGEQIDIDSGWTEEETEGPLILDVDNYNRVTDLLWDQPERFREREIIATGFVYKPPELSHGQFILGRYLIFCCIADAIVTGFMAEFPPDTDVEENQWVEIRGTAGIGTYYEQETGVVFVEEYEIVDAPSNPYVFY